MSKFPELPLRDISEEWQREWDALMEDEWLRGKLLRERVMREHIDYLSQYVPEFFTAVSPGQVVDIGPGVGVLLEIARAMGHEAIGVDALPGSDSGMGATYVRACELMWQRQGLGVLQIGGRRLFELAGTIDDVVLFNMRGSLEQTFCEFFNEPVNHSQDLKWMMGEDLTGALRRMVRFFHGSLRSCGSVVIHANGSRNGRSVDGLLDGLASEAGFRVQLAELRIHKWVKR